MSQEKKLKKDQFNRFVETARELGCDEDKKRFEKSLGKIAAYKPPKKPSEKAAKPAAKMKSAANAASVEASEEMEEPKDRGP